MRRRAWVMEAVVGGGEAAGADYEAPALEEWDDYAMAAASSSSLLGTQATLVSTAAVASNSSSEGDFGNSTADIIGAASAAGDPEWTDVLTTILKACIMGFIIVAALCGNLLVIVSVMRHRKLRVITNYFVVSLAFADMLVAMVAMTFNASVQITGRWLFGPVMCDMWNSLDVYFSTASILHLCCISVDRYYAIVRPLKYPINMTKRVVAVMLVNVWVSPAVISFVPIFLGWYTTQEHLAYRLKHPDICEFKVNQVYALLSSSISFWIPCTIMVFTYLAIFLEANRQEKQLHSRFGNAMLLSNALHEDDEDHGSGTEDSGSRSRPGGRANGSNNGHRAGDPRIIEPNGELVLLQVGVSGGSSKALTLHEVLAETPPPPAQVPGTPPQQETPVMSQHHLAPPPPPHFRPPTTTVTSPSHSTATGGEEAPSSAAPTPPTSSPSPPPPSTPSKSSRLHPPAHHHHQHHPTPTKDRAIASKMKREHKAARTLGIIMGAFILCWLPFFLWYVITTICGDEVCHCPDIVVAVLFWIGYFNSTLNPLIYAYFNRDFREAFRNTLQCAFCSLCRRPPSDLDALDAAAYYHHHGGGGLASRRTSSTLRCDFNTRDRTRSVYSETYMKHIDRRRSSEYGSSL
ncbi:octopamine receptor beta-2R-like [Ischnura elegans]|uniref:octopamine receptor beta-2R-like n=1 Tax=Ischnura elegans TaxID=197161 RepID=UPI001ED88D46|nr:octopamine receptor beta-2R-like [Ischnura elegans]